MEKSFLTPQKSWQLMPLRAYQLNEGHRKTAETTGEMLGNEIAEKITTIKQNKYKIQKVK